MSIVLVGLTPQFAIAMSDGRVTSPNKTIVNENFKKLIRINPYVCVGITGSEDFFHMIQKQLFSIPINIQNINTDKTFEILYNISKNIMVDNSFLKDSSIAICGVNSKKQIESLAFCTKDYVVSKQDPNITGLAIHVLCDYPNSFEIAKSNIVKSMNLIKGMKNTIKYISKVYEGINDTIFTERIDL